MLSERETVTLFGRFMLLICTATIAICGQVRNQNGPRRPSTASDVKPARFPAGYCHSSPGAGEVILWGDACDGPARGSNALLTSRGAP